MLSESGKNPVYMTVEYQVEMEILRKIIQCWYRFSDLYKYLFTIVHFLSKQERRKDAVLAVFHTSSSPLTFQGKPLLETQSCIKDEKVNIVLNLNQSDLELIKRARCKNGLSDEFGPPFTKPQNYLISCNAAVAKGIMLCSQHIVLVIWMEFPPKHYQVSLLLTRKEKFQNAKKFL